MFTKEEYDNRKIFLEYPEPPIELIDITDTILYFMSMVSHVDLPFKYPKEKPSFTTNLSNQSLNEYLMNMITLPHENYVSESLKTLFMLDAIAFKTKEKAVITPIGKAMIKLTRNASIQMARAIIESFNYRCSREIIDIASVLEQIEGKMDGLIDQFRSKAKENSPEYNTEEKHYNKVVKSLTSPYGDMISIYNIVHTYKKLKAKQLHNNSNKNNSNKNNSSTQNLANKWAKEHFINVNKLKKAKKTYSDLDRNLHMIIRNVRYDKKNNNNNSNKKFMLFRNIEPKIHDKIEDNITQALITGYITNIVQKVGKNYATCFPKIQTFAGIDKNSLFNKVSVKPTNCFYDTYFGMKGIKRLSIFNKIPEKVIKEIDPHKREIISQCSKKIKNSHSSFTSKKQSSSKSKRRSSSKSKRRSSSKSKKKSSSKRRSSSKRK
jgi:hypothetical protein